MDGPWTDFQQSDTKPWEDFSGGTAVAEPPATKTSSPSVPADTDTQPSAESFARGVKAIDVARAQVPTGPVDYSQHPVQAFMKGVGQVGKGVYGILADIGTGESPLQGGSGENVKAAIAGEKAPFEVRAEAPGIPKSLALAQKTAAGVVEMAPKLAMVTAGQAIGIPAPVAAGAIFGFDDEGKFSPKQAAIAAALPVVGKWGGALSEGVATKLWITSEAAKGLINAGGGYASANALLAAQSLPGWSKMTDVQKQDAVAGILANGLLGLADMHGLKTENGKVNLDAASKVFQQAAEKAQQGIAPIEARIKANVPRGTSPAGTETVATQQPESEVPNATQKRQVEGNVQPERRGDDTRGTPAEPGGSGSVPAAGGETTPSRQPPTPVRPSDAEVLTPAVRKDGVVYEAQPGQKNHGAIKLAQAKEGVDILEGEHGFVQNGKFLNRGEAAKAFESQTGKMPDKPGELHSEDLDQARLLKHLEPKPWQKFSETKPEDFGAMMKSVKGNATTLGYDLATKITAEDIPALKAEAKKAALAHTEISDAGQMGDMGQKSQLFKESIRMREALDEAVAKGAKNDAELAVIANDHGVGVGEDDATKSKDLKAALQKLPKGKEAIPDAKEEKGQEMGILKPAEPSATVAAETPPEDVNEPKSAKSVRPPAASVKSEEQLHNAIADAFSKTMQSLKDEGWKFDPHFGPLEVVLKPETLGQFMFMGDHPHPTIPGRRLYEYKNGITRRYLRLDDEGNAYGYNHNAKTEAQKYPSIDLEKAIDDSFGQQSKAQREEKYNEEFRRKRDEALIRGGFGVSRPTSEGTLTSFPKTSPIPPGPGAATNPGATAATDIGALESNMPPLAKLATAVQHFPEQKGGGFKEKMRQWLDSVGIPAKEQFFSKLNSLRAIPDWVKEKATTLPAVNDLDRRVGQWNGAEWENSQAAREFNDQIKDKFKDRSKLRALSNWINAGGDKELLARQAQLAKDPATRKTYEDALKFGGEEEKLASAIRQYHDEMLARGKREGVLEEGLENYLHRYYRDTDPVLEKKLAALRYMQFTKDFAGFKKRYYDSDFEAEQAGLKPEKDAGKRILAYDYGFNRALIAREFVRKSFDTAKAVAKDGRPELGIAGSGTRIEGDGKGVTLIKPKTRLDTGDPKDYRGDYVQFDHPAFKKWKFATTDSAGKPILVQGDILVHPDFANKYKALFEKSWWSKGPVRRAVLGVSNFTKQTMLQGPFHLFQITTGGVEHRINPFKLMDLNPSDPAQRRMAEAGLFAEQGAPYMTDGVAGGGLLDKIPIAGEYLQNSKDWLFNDYIPRWKMTLALTAEARNMERYKKDIQTGKITPEQVTRMSARQAAAVFGGQNQRAIFRSRTTQDTLRALFLAPDFGEERLRQVLQAGGKYGYEQRAALVAGAIGMIFLAKTIEKALTGKMDLSLKHLMTVTYNGKEYGMRNPASDIAHFISDPQGYVRNRLNPIYTRPLLELANGRDQFGRKRTFGQQLTDEIKQVVPLPARGLVEKGQTLLESLLNSTGLTEHRRSAFSDEMKDVNRWKESKGYTEPGEFVYDPDKDPYHGLTSELSVGSDASVAKQLKQLLAGKSAAERGKVMKHYRRSLASTKDLTGSRAHEAEYVKQLSPGGRQAYEAAKAERKAMWEKFLKAAKAEGLTGG